MSDFLLGICIVATVLAIAGAFIFVGTLLGICILMLFLFIIAIEKPWKNLPQYGPPNIDPNETKYPEEKE